MAIPWVLTPKILSTKGPPDCDFLMQFTYLGPQWAQAATAPSRMYKGESNKMNLSPMCPADQKRFLLSCSLDH